MTHPPPSSRTSAEPPVVTPPVVDRSPFAGLPVVNLAANSPVLDPGAVGSWSKPAVNEIERGAVCRFADSLGETNPIYFDPDAARSQGYRDVVAPLTFAFTLRSSLELQEAGQPNRTVLTSDQQVESFAPICVGDRISVCSRVAEITQRPGNVGPLEFVVVEDEGRTADDQLVFRTRRTLIIRSGREQPAAGGE